MLLILALVALWATTHGQILECIQQQAESQLGKNSCVAYYDEPEQICPVGEHCIGSCRFRYCGSTLIEALDQSKCVESTHESCAPHYNDIRGVRKSLESVLYQERVHCVDGEYCSGDCMNRFCSSTGHRLDQEDCNAQIVEDRTISRAPGGFKYLNTPGEICGAYTDAWGVERDRGECPPFFSCCGTCNNRYCNFVDSKRLDQSTCRWWSLKQDLAKYETCEGYFNALGYYQPRQRCSPDHVCNGNCEMRACRYTFKQFKQYSKGFDQTTCGEEHKRRRIPEPCKAYLNIDQRTGANVTHDEQVCSFGTTCCGECDNRYCCNSYRFKLDQTSCYNDQQPQKQKQHEEQRAFCEAYYDEKGEYWPRYWCTQKGQICTGHCKSRFCSRTGPVLDQLACEMLVNINNSTGLPMPIFEANYSCDAYIDNQNTSIESKVCAEGEQCCGWCNSRYCCSDPSEKLNQTTCLLHFAPTDLFMVINDEKTILFHK